MRTHLKLSFVFAGITLLVLSEGCAKQPQKQKPVVEKAAVPVKQGQPEIAVEEKSYDFGKVKEGTNVEHVFKIKNAGESEPVIERVRSSCGCTVAQPRSIWLGQLQWRAKGSADFTVEVSDPERIKIKSVKVENKAFGAGCCGFTAPRKSGRQRHQGVNPPKDSRSGRI